MVALPFMASALSARSPAGVIDPLPVVVIQFVCLLGPAWNTVPFACANSHIWLSERTTPAGSWVRAALASTPDSSFQLPVAPLGVKISPFLLPAPSYHEPPSVSTWPVESGVSALYARGMFMSGPWVHLFVVGS